MNNTENGWGDFMNSYFGKPVNHDISKDNVDTGYTKFEKEFYQKAEIEAKEPVIPNEKFEKDTKSEDVCEEILPKEIEMVEIDDEDLTHGIPVPSEGFREIMAKHLEENDAIEEIPVIEDGDEPSDEEIKAFKELNGITDDVVVEEQPTETKVKSVKISKPKAEKPVKKDKEPKAKAPKAPKKTTKK